MLATLPSGGLLTDIDLRDIKLVLLRQFSLSESAYERCYKLRAVSVGEFTGLVAAVLDTKLELIIW